ncbi:hint-domain-containing protein [Cladorrhinum sp. PSN332]|nr:hint-domain-containing protein [Cladorrhinum sp. PSN332]
MPPSVQIHPLEAENGLIVKIEPPKEPQDPSLDHVPCDMVLSIDVSGSMGSEAPVPRKQGEAEENYGLSVLDLVKHAAKTILETLDDRDRLGIVTFSSTTTVLQPLTPVTKENKQEILSKIDQMKPTGMTNLWHGILDGLKLFNSPEEGSDGRVPALLVLTDGIPNHMCPSQGYVPKLQSKGDLPATIHTFGFGNNLNSGLLKSISEIGGGGYSFIPDAGMIGTVFVHAVANLQSTFANNAVLKLTYPSYLGLEETTGEAVEKQPPQEITGDVPESLTQLTITLSNIQYGQSRDVFLRYSSSTKSILAHAEKSGSAPIITAILSYSHFTPFTRHSSTHQSLFFPHPAANTYPPLSREEIAYHVTRSLLISFLSQFYPLNAQSEHALPQHLPTDLLTSKLPSLISSLPAFNFPNSALCQSLLSDLCGPTQTEITESWTGQISLALQPRYFHKWGKHYLPSLAGAYARQQCNTFKDPGPLLFGSGSALFIRCRDKLDEAFDNLPAPEPSCIAAGRGARYGYGYGRFDEGGHGVSMGRYNDRAGSCFASMARVRLANGESIRIGKLRRGMQVLTPGGKRGVVGVVRTEVNGMRMSLVGNKLLVTPWHPVRIKGEWKFPREVERRGVRYTGAIYSVLLERGEAGDVVGQGHAVLVDGVWGVTMGHGIVRGKKDKRAHEFFGDWERVYKAMKGLRAVGNGLVLAGGVTREERGSGLVNGFLRVAPAGREMGNKKDARVVRKRSLYL